MPQLQQDKDRDFIVQ